jgi:hypothetical protein
MLMQSHRCDWVLQTMLQQETSASRHMASSDYYDGGLDQNPLYQWNPSGSWDLLDLQIPSRRASLPQYQ